MKPSFKDVFWIINQESFQPKIDKTWLQKDKDVDLERIYYQKIIPVYVKCVSEMYDGSTQFDITPVDIRDGKTKNWQWSRAVSDSELDKTVFRTKRVAEKKFDSIYTPQQKAIFKEKEQFHRLQS